MTDFTSIHPDFAAFNQTYADEIKPQMEALEAERRAAMQKFINRLPIAGIIGVFLAVVMFVIWKHPIVSGLGGLAAAVVCAIGFYMPVNKVAQGAREVLLGQIVAALDLGHTEKGFEPPEFQTFRDYKLLPGDDRRGFEDLVTGERHGAPFYVYEAHLETVSRDKDGKETWHTVFRGQLLKIAYPKPFLGKTIVARDAGWFNGMSKPGREFSQVGMASPRFEKLFEAWSTDQVEARELLDPVVLERFLELENLFRGKKPRVAFADGAMYMAVETGDVLKKNLGFGALDSDQRIGELLAEFAIIYNLIDVIVKPVQGRIEGGFSIEHLRGQD